MTSKEDQQQVIEVLEADCARDKKISNF